MRGGGLAAALAVLTGCSLVSLDELEAGSSAGGGSSASSAAGGGPSSTGASTATGDPSSSSTGAGAGGAGTGGDGTGAATSTSTGGAGGAGSGGAGPSSLYRQAVLDDGPSIYLRFDEVSPETTARDETGNHDGIYQPGADQGLPGALFGDPSTAVGSVATSPGGAVNLGDVLDFASGSVEGPLPYSLELWFRALELPMPGDELHFLIMKDQQVDGERVGYVLALFPQLDGGDAPFWALGTERFAIGDDAALYPFPTAVSIDDWHHVVVTFQEAAFYLYLDGDELSSDAGSSAVLSATTAPLAIGASSAFGLAFTGEIDEVALYPHALGEDDVKEHHRIGTEGR